MWKAIGAGLLLALFLSAEANAQDDFPFSPGIEPWNQCCLPTPTAPFDYTTGRAFGAIQLWGTPRGSHIAVDVVLDWWGLGPLLLSVISPNESNMHWTGPDTPQGHWFHPNFGAWCLRCTWEFDAGDDNPQIWLDYIGSSAFGAHLEVVSITPPQRQPLFSATTKARLGSLSTDLGYTSAIFFGTAGFVAESGQIALAAHLGMWGTICQIGSIAAGNLATHDPYDAAACAAGPIYRDPTELGMRWYDGVGDPLAGTEGEGALPYYWNAGVIDAQVIEAYTSWAIACYPDEYDKARYIALAIAPWLDDLANNTYGEAYWLGFLNSDAAGAMSRLPWELNTVSWSMNNE